MDVKAKRKALLKDYNAPEFYTDQEHSLDGLIVPTQCVSLANLPTPIEPFSLPELPEDTALFIKRDDYTGGIELCGNKVRKLEFLFADAIANEYDEILTIGGTQSNHARATTGAARKLFSFPTHLLLRKDSPGRNGNFFLNTLLGANIVEIERDALAKMKTEEGWMQKYATSLEKDGKRVYPIPVGGSNSLGCWGYLEAVREMNTQLDLSEYSDICVCTGSGATVAGLGLGLNQLRKSKPSIATQLTAYGVCDSPDIFYDVIGDLMRGIGKSVTSAKDVVTVKDAKGLGYAKNTDEELQFLSRVARESGLILDPCYTAKTVLKMWKDLRSGELRPSAKTLYVHTGGAPSVFDKVDVLAQ